MNGKDFAIGVLSVTAVILFTGLVLIQAVSPQAAQAGAISTHAGEYVITTCRLDENTELVVILDTISQKMNVYGIDALHDVLQLVQRVDVRPQQQAKPKPARPGR